MPSFLNVEVGRPVHKAANRRPYDRSLLDRIVDIPAMRKGCAVLAVFVISITFVSSWHAFIRGHIPRGTGYFFPQKPGIFQDQWYLRVDLASAALFLKVGCGKEFVVGVGSK